MTERQNDAKLVYNGTLNDLVKLAEKYGVSSARLQMIASGEINADNFASIGIAAFPTTSDQKQIRGKLYVAIKGAA